MKMKVLLFLLIVFAFSAQAQDKLLIYGKITDSQTKEPIPYASITFKKINYKTASDATGEFIVKIPSQHLKDKYSLTISCIGYQTLDTTLSYSSSPLVLSLKQDSYSLQEVVVHSDKALTAEEIVQKAFNRIPKNYSTKPYIMNIFYRNYCREDSLYRLVEAAGEVYDTKGNKKRYGKPKQKVQVRINQLRRSIDYTKLYPHHSYISIYRLLDQDITSYKSDVSKVKGIYSYAILDTLFQEGQQVFVITYQHKVDNSKKKNPFIRKLNGKLYIYASDFAFLKTTELLTDHPVGLEDSLISREYNEVFYKKSEQTYFVDRILKKSHHFKTVYDSLSKRSLPKRHDTYLELQVKSIKKENIIPFKGREPHGDQLAQYRYDSTFWAGNPLPKANPLPREIITYLEKEKPLHEQFKLMASAATHGQTQASELSYTFTRADTLRGALTPLRSLYDVNYYHLSVEVKPNTKSIKGSNLIRFTVATASDRLQIDLVRSMAIEKITFKGKKIKFSREYDAVFVQFPEVLSQGSIQEIEVYYSGQPKELDLDFRWTGGFLWKKDKEGNPWVTVVCQGLGASLWWPNKDHLSDEPDSMLISVTAPEGLTNVSNGRLRATEKLPDGRTRYHWFISYPINNYNVTLNVGIYEHFNDLYIKDKDTLTLDYYVMPESVAKAKKYVGQVKPMLAIFEKYFGPYPFPRDGFKLVESVYIGMEHQSAIAIGDQFETGTDDLGQEKDFSQLLIHESGHEWWGNSVSMKDIADMWIHEGFCTYAEALYIEERFGYSASQEYINAMDVIGKEPILGKYNVNHVFYRDDDMYPKGALLLNTLRHVLNNDSLWFSILKGITQTFKYQTVTTGDIVVFINKATGREFTCFFNQYLQYATLPKLEYFFEKEDHDVVLVYRWKADVPDFNMPIQVTTSPESYEFIYPTSSWKRTALKNIKAENFNIAEDKFYIESEQVQPLKSTRN